MPHTLVLIFFLLQMAAKVVVCLSLLSEFIARFNILKSSDLDEKILIPRTCFKLLNYTLWHPRLFGGD